MYFTKGETPQCIRMQCILHRDQLKEIPKYYIWLMSNHHKPKDDTQKDKYTQLHEHTANLAKLIKSKVAKFRIAFYIYKNTDDANDLAKHLQNCRGLRQALTLYIDKSDIAAFIIIKPLSGQSHMISTGDRERKHRAKAHQMPKSLNVATTPINKARGIQGKYAVEAPRLGIHTIKDALLFFPDGNNFKEIDEYVSGHHFTHHQDLHFQDGKDLSADVYRTSRIISQKCRNGSLRLAFHCVPAEDKTALKTAKQLYHDKRGFWVNTFDFDRQKEDIENSNFYKVRGPWNSKYSNISISATKGREKGAIQPYHGMKITTIGKYTQKTGVPEKDIRHMMLKVIPNYAQYAKQLVPAKILREHKLMGRGEAIFNCHFPKDESLHKDGLVSEKFQELYQYAYKLAKLHQQRSRKSGFAIDTNIRLLTAFNNSLPYELTRDQKKAVEDILYDLRKPYQMARLLQGDVGSGKTVVAAFAVLAVISAGYQVAIMIPTTVLGEQHYKTFTTMFRGTGIRIALMTGKTSSHDKRITLKKVADGKIDLLIGTEALYQKKTQYKGLGLVVIDEQHRFGVRQRRALEDKTKGCNILSMTATPIPRTLAIAIFHAMDVSQIRTMPQGRKAIITKWFTSKQATPAYLKREIMQRVREGGQTFVITKLVKSSSNPMMKGMSNAQDVYKKMKMLFSDTDIRVALITGQIKDDEKNRILADFARGKFQVLVATSVVEVGVDIPRANNMIILDADRYGLAQLHQLRGRVGRNSMQAYCLLLADLTTNTGEKRMKVMERTSDGFKVAQADLRIRHGGNIFGNVQHGLPDFPLANLANPDDMQIFQIAQQDAQRAIRNGK